MSIIRRSIGFIMVALGILFGQPERDPRIDPIHLTTRDRSGNNSYASSVGSSQGLLSFSIDTANEQLYI